MINKRANTAGDFISTFVSILVIFLLLTIFVVVSGSVKSFFGNRLEKNMQIDNSLDSEDGVGYMENYAKLVEARSISKNKNLDLDEGLLEVRYEK